MDYRHCVFFTSILGLMSLSCIPNKMLCRHEESCSNLVAREMVPDTMQFATCTVPLTDGIQTAFCVTRTTSDADLVASLGRVWPEVPLDGTDIVLLHETGEILVSGDRINTYITKAFLELSNKIKELPQYPIIRAPNVAYRHYHFLHHLNSVHIAEVEFDNVPFEEAISNLLEMADCRFFDYTNKSLDLESMDSSSKKRLLFMKPRTPNMRNALSNGVTGSSR